MFNRSNKINLGVLILLSGLVLSPAYADVSVSQGSLVPGDTNGLYYQIGGGDVTPLPYAPDSSDIYLNVNGNAGLGYNCGVFNPEASIVNSLNNMDASFEKMITHVISNAEGALMELPAYKLAQAMPDLYKLIQDGIGNGQFDFNVSTKSCQQMVSEVGSGKNPYNDWLQASLGDDWKYHMSLADSQAAASGMLGSSSQDINAAKKQVDQDNGKSGVQWVRGIKKNGEKYAGGQGQPTIYLTYDIAVAGYNVLIAGNRSYDDTNAPSKTTSNARLVDAFPNPKVAGQWVAKVVGEQEITTFANGQKQSIPGIGLLGDVQTEAATIKKNIVDLVDGSQTISLDRLKAISPPKVMLNSAVIQMLRKQTNPLMQAIYVNKIAQEVAVARAIDKAKLGLQLLEVGSQVPSIYANNAAQKGTKADEDRMRQWISELRNNPKDNEEFVGSTIAILMGAINTQEVASSAIRPSENTPPTMQNGAIKTGQ